MKIKSLILTGIAALLMASSAACVVAPVHPVYAEPACETIVGVDSFGQPYAVDCGYVPYSWQWYYWHRHHRRPYEGRGGYRNYDSRGGFHRR